MTGGCHDVIADCDTVIVAPPWDSVLIRVLGEVSIVGAAYEDIGGFSSGPGPRATSSAEARVLHGTNDYNEEFHLRGRPFVVPRRGSHQHPFRSVPLSAAFYAAIESYLRGLGAPVSKDTGAG